MTTRNPDHFDHEDHRERLARAADALESQGLHELAGACRRARSLHVNLIGRVSHARQAIRKLRKINPQVRLAREALGLLERYVAQPEAPWLVPAPVLFPSEEDSNE